MEEAKVIITQEMIDYCREAIPVVQVHRTKASPYDTLGGLLGELIFAEWFLGSWREHNVYDTKGKEDFFNEIEIKTSIFPFSKNLNLLVREDYASKRKPKFYIQIILDIENRNQKIIPAGTNGILAGFASHKEVDQAPLKDFGSKFGNKGGYRCRYISIRNLHPISKFKLIYNSPNAL
mgnify:FL=1|tara:strand:+ start:19 stop:552 length:534 start_codon:yes stop_codon:yes gene_type:complete